jgi:hypothetical protein
MKLTDTYTDAMEATDEICCALDEAIAQIHEAVKLLEATRNSARQHPDPEVRRVVAGQLDQYTIPSLRRWLDENLGGDHGQPGNLRKLWFLTDEASDQ